MEDYLIETLNIDYMNPFIQEKFHKLRSISEDQLDYIKRCYMFVRDAISHSWNIETNIVSKIASEALKNKTGIFWTKSYLLAALLRADRISSGISYQLLTRVDNYDSEGYIIHVLNTVYIKDLDKWIRLDARENKKNINSCFNLDEECLAYSIQSKLG